MGKGESLLFPDAMHDIIGIAPITARLTSQPGQAARMHEPLSSPVFPSIRPWTLRFPST